MILFLCFLISAAALAQPAPEAAPEPVAILELGAVPAHSVKDSGHSIGPTLAVEFTPIENWLELEMGVTASYGRHSTEWSSDLLFKKPWSLSKKVEFMFGAGPEWIRTREAGVTRNSAAAEVALDFMFWPSPKRRFGWYIEPAWEYNFARGHDQSIGISCGLLIGIPRRR